MMCLSLKTLTAKAYEWEGQVLVLSEGCHSQTYVPCGHGSPSCHNPVWTPKGHTVFGPNWRWVPLLHCSPKHPSAPPMPSSPPPPVPSFVSAWFGLARTPVYSIHFVAPVL